MTVQTIKAMKLPQFWKLFIKILLDFNIKMGNIFRKASADASTNEQLVIKISESAINLIEILK